MTLLRTAWGALSLLGVLCWLGLVALPSILILGVAARFVGAPRRLVWVSRWAGVNCRAVLAILRVGGARYTRRGWIATDAPGIIIMNHQSVLDIPTAILMTGPVVPGFIARKRYARVPVIGTGLWIADCPVIDPGADREGAVACLRRAAWQDRTLLIYPEGHRTQTGGLQPFRTAGLLAMLAERRVPVWLLATEGYCSGRRLLDLVQVHRIDGLTEVVGRYDPPADEAELPAFLDGLHAILAARLEEMRSGRGVVSPSPGAADASCP